jgi:hypothetical protein
MKGGSGAPTPREKCVNRVDHVMLRFKIMQKCIPSERTPAPTSRPASA